MFQDVRHRHASEGDGKYFRAATPTEGPDGYDTVEWLAAQPWCGGRVGTMGVSYDGIVQQVMAFAPSTSPQHRLPGVAPADSHAHQARLGGTFQLFMFGALFLHALHAQEALRDPAVQSAIAADLMNMRELVWQAPYRPIIPAGQAPAAPGF